MNSERAHGVRLDLTLQDSFYYASREAGETFLTKPVVMHTALYYALGLFPSAFRIAEHSPRYTEHRDEAELGERVYIHPAIATDHPSYTTRRFAVKPDGFRQESTQRSSNFKETGRMKMIDPGLTFRTYAVCDSAPTRDTLLDQLPVYARIGKKLSLARVDTAAFDATVEDGSFTLTHPIADIDLNQDRYEIRGNLQWKRMNPVDLITKADCAGPHITLDTSMNGEQTETVLPTELRFLNAA